MHEIAYFNKYKTITSISTLRPVISQNNLNNKGFLYKYNDYKKNCER